MIVVEVPGGLGVHVIEGEALLEMLRRTAAGESPDMVFAEAWANAEHEHVDMGLDGL